MASGRDIAAQVAVSRRASIDFPAAESRAAGHYGHNACIPVSFALSSPNDGGEHGTSVR